MATPLKPPAPFAPIAIVARACVLPGAFDPESLWAAVLAGSDLTRPADPARWRMPAGSALSAPGTLDPDRAVHDRVGAVSDFAARWNPEGFAVPASALANLDPLVHWLLHTSRSCLRATRGDRTRTGAVFGNLGFPSEAMARFAESVWLGEPPGDPRNRFMSGGTAAVVAEALGLDLGAYCLDAACASALYAIDAACTALNEGRADLMLAGAVQRADDLFLHVGFSALTALSRSGRSRPFHREADGLVPAEGAVVFALKRLADARRDGDHVHGIIRGIGLANDGRGRGLLVPDADGQERCLRLAYARAGIDPAEIGLLECHATGTTVGDATEITSAARVFGQRALLPIGSLKSNLGHLITAAGGAGLLKVLSAMEHGVLPPTRIDGDENPVLADTPFRVLRTPEPWSVPPGKPRLAAVSAFGFGGNNAHLIVSADDPTLPAPALPAPCRVPLALVGLGLQQGRLGSRAAVDAALVSGDVPAEHHFGAITVDLDGLRLPPRDLARCLPQQLVLFDTTRAALAGIAPVDTARCGVFVGMEPDPDVARYGLRWRLANHVAGDTLASARDGVVPALDSAAVLGAMPNIPANRISAQHDFGGPSLTVQALGDSGLAAFDLAVGPLCRGDLDAAIVAAVDLATHPVTVAAAPESSADAVVVWVLKRLADAERDGDPVWAVFEPTHQAANTALIDARWGNPGAALALRDWSLRVLQRNRDLDADRCPAVLPIGPDRLELPLGQSWSVRSPDPGRSCRDIDVPKLVRYAGPDRASVRDAVRQQRAGGTGPCCLVLLARPDEWASVHERALALLDQGVPAGPNVFFRESPITGGTAFVFAGAGASYPDMGRALLADLPFLKDRLRVTAPRLLEGLGAAFRTGFADADPGTQLIAASALAQMHLGLSEDLLDLRADAWLGYSSGETNALFASGAWQDPDGLMADMARSALMTDHLAGPFRTLDAQWPGHAGFATWTVLAPLDEVRGLLADFPRVRLLIIDSSDQALVAGDRAQCAAFVDRIGRARCLPLSYSLVVHMPEVRAVAADWFRLHHRPTFPLRHGRLYSSAWARAYEPDAETCAQAILDQATDTLDMRPVIEQAWQDGIRVFIEHGPGGSFARAIRSQLGDREALVLSLDRKGLGLEGVLQAAAALLSAGIPVDVDRLLQQSGIAPRPVAPKRPLTLPGHWPPVRLPGALAHGDGPGIAVMRPAPALPPVAFRPWTSRPGPATARPTNPTPPERAEAQIAPPPPQPTPTLVRAAPKAPAIPARATPVPAIAAMTAQIEALSRVHQDWVRHQTEAHQRFMAIRQNAMATLLAMPHESRAPTHSWTPTNPGTATDQPNSRTPTDPRPSVDAHPSAGMHSRTSTSLSAVPKSRAPKTAAQRQPVGPTFSRADLEVHADGAISTIYGPAFAGQDGFERQVRMPKPPLLLADRVVGLDAEPMRMGTGTIWTETDVRPDAWYVHHGHMPAGIMIEAGQADLMLISWVGIDQFNRSERVYRLLGCELTYHGDLPRVGDTIRFQIELDGHAAQGDVRLMFFHYDCVNGDRPQLSVRQGQAGFFTDQELAESAGCLWSPETQDIRADARVDPPVVPVRSQFDRAALEAFAAGDLVTCFGDAFAFTRTHTRTPTIAGGDRLLFDRVVTLDPAGGPWERGYLRAELDIHPDQWFFDGHFKNDPCMPGTLMFEACLAAMAFYQAALGDTLKRDGWRFQPVPEVPYKLQCRGQVTPASRRLVTELFIEERHDGPVPTLYADLLCTVDGLKAFHARRVGLQLVPDWPMAHAADIPAGELTRPVATVDGFRFDRRALLACADGRPSEAFGPMYRRFDGVQRVARLPSPPYHFISRIAEIEGPIGVMKAGARVVAEYDIPDQAWYFDTNGDRTMPFAVLLEAALQPCGWLSSYVGSALTQEIELGFRNLDGDGTILGEIRPGDGTLSTEVRLTDVSASGGMIIEGFEVDCRIGDRPVYRLKTVFGFFPEAALAAQAGLPPSPVHQALRSAAPEHPTVLAPTLPGLPRQAHGMLRMIDGIEGWWPEGGRAGLGAARACKHIDTSEWFFKAHFFQDPVQPGSLGLEAMVHTLAWVMVEQGLAAGFRAPRFQTIATGIPHRWKYRGQVLPKHRLVQTTLEVTGRGRDDLGTYAIADASLWVDGQRIYEASGLALRIVEADP